jgi:hypothetical protein
MNLRAIIIICLYKYRKHMNLVMALKYFKAFF